MIKKLQLGNNRVAYETELITTFRIYVRSVCNSLTDDTHNAGKYTAVNAERMRQAMSKVRGSTFQLRNQFKMLPKCVAKIFALEPKANAIESGIITALILTALLVAVLAVREPLAAIYSSFMGDVLIGTR
ncbi:MAG: hypothetical protein IPK78_07200 [Rhodospirillales bacterium]|nr:hypothetical protein [Rhodospirillales bacterium]